MDQNARLGRKPGDPKSTDPDAQIRQPYTQHQASGGFLLVEVEPGRGRNPPSLAFRFHDDLGKILYECAKAPGGKSNE